MTVLEQGVERVNFLLFLLILIKLEWTNIKYMASPLSLKTIIIQYPLLSLSAINSLPQSPMLACLAEDSTTQNNCTSSSRKLATALYSQTTMILMKDEKWHGSSFNHVAE